MITQEDAIQICKQKFLTEHDTLSVIQRYIYDCKGVEVDLISPGRNVFQIQLMNVAMDSACNYYLSLS